MGIVATIGNTHFYKIQVRHGNVNEFKTSRWKFYATTVTNTAEEDKKLLQILQVDKMLIKGLLDMIMIVKFYKTRIRFWIDHGKIAKTLKVYK